VVTFAVATSFWYGVAGIIGLVLLIGVVGFIQFVRHSRYTAAQAMLWMFAKFVSSILWRVRVEGEFPLQEETGAVVICNHRSSIDPFFIQTAVRYVIHWMVASEYFSHPAFGWFIRTAEAIPVNRGGIDTASTKAAIRIVSQGGAVGMLPEGRINTTGQFMQSVRPGAVVVALRGRGKIVPCFIDGAPYRGTAWSPFLMRARVRVRFGAPIDLSEYHGREGDSELVRELLVKCVKEIAALAGQEDFEPTIAGRKWKPDPDDAETP